MERHLTAARSGDLDSALLLMREGLRSGSKTVARAGLEAIQAALGSLEKEHQRTLGSLDWAEHRVWAAGSFAIAIKRKKLRQVKKKIGALNTILLDHAQLVSNTQEFIR